MDTKVDVIQKVTAQHSDINSFDLANLTQEQKKIIENQMRKEKGDEYVDNLKAGKLYDGACPANPFEKVMCESCQ
jgi:hypothetical protein